MTGILEKDGGDLAHWLVQDGEEEGTLGEFRR